MVMLSPLGLPCNPPPWGMLTAVDLEIASGGGTLSDNGDGTWTYTPAANASDSTIQNALHAAASRSDTSCAFRWKTPRSSARTSRTKTVKAA